MNNIDMLISDLIPQLLRTFTALNVKEIILYGSVARGTATSESDIDIAVILDDYTDKMHNDMIDFVVELELKYNKVISVLLIYNRQFNEWGNITPFFKNIKKDGKVLWKSTF
ncbi:MULTISPECIES: nucleotidyltransferase family protein [Phascolarctobacterium]|uniref:nucleotidyltransferase family protein n=1 Tax=Phascolarctobacterium TaxID=33024 RepID=UPI0025D1A727|nr:MULTISPECIES: nucleotidyltransferase domain-containing protein [Phascolarctobacterium]